MAPVLVYRATGGDHGQCESRNLLLDAWPSDSNLFQRILRDDPAKGLTAIKEPVHWSNIKEAWMDKSMWGLYIIGLVAYIPATPVQGYLTLTLRRIGFSTFDANMLTVPSAMLQIFTMLAISYSSNRFNDRAFHVIFGEAWVLPLLVSMLTLPDGGRDWSRFTLVTLISGCKTDFPWLSELNLIANHTRASRSILPSYCLLVDLREQLRCEEASNYRGHIQRHCAGWLIDWLPDLPS